MAQLGATVWDLPLRLFHWALVSAVAGAYASAEVFPTADLFWHKLAGYTVLWLLLFRLIWGFCGSATARFAAFVPGPRKLLAYLRGTWAPQAGHNPLGALSVMALLAVLAVQVVSGLFNGDEVLAEGPWFGLLSAAGQDLASEIHGIGETLLLVLIGLHLVALVFHARVKRRRLLPAMIGGRDPHLPVDLSIQPVSNWRALAVALLCGLVVWLATQRLPGWLGAGAGLSFG